MTRREFAINVMRKGGSSEETIQKTLGVMKMWYNDRLVYDRQSWRVLKEDND